MNQDQNGTDPKAGEAPEEVVTDTYQIPGWQAGLPAAYRGHASLKDMATPGHLFEAFQSQADRLSQIDGRTYVPGEDASSEDWATYRKAIGVPESKEGYEFRAYDDMDKNEVDAISSWVRDVAFEQGLPVKVAQNVYDRWINDTRNTRKTMHEQQVQQAQEKEKALKEKYGEKWETRRDSAKNFVKTHLGENVFNSMQEKGLLDSSDYLDAFGGLSEKLGEDSLPDTGGSPGGGGGENRLDGLFPSM